MKRRLIAGLLFAGLTATASPAFAVIDLIGDPDGFGFNALSPAELAAKKAADGGAADRDLDKRLEPGDALPDTADADGNRNGEIGPEDAFDFRSVAEQGADGGAQLTDVSNEGLGAVDLKTFTFSFTLPAPTDPDYGQSHYLNVVYSDYDIAPVTMEIVSSAEPTIYLSPTQTYVFSPPSEEGIIRMSWVEVPWSELADGKLEVVIHAENETFLAFDYALLSPTVWSDANGDGIPDILDSLPCWNAGGDFDEDGACDDVDNCVDVANADQADADGNGIGDACDIPVDLCADFGGDADGDEICGAVDNCPAVANADQADADKDGVGNVCDKCHDPDADDHCGDADNCPLVANKTQLDTDWDLTGDACDTCPLDHWNDSDGDGYCGNVDTCSGIANPDQTDTDADGLGDICDTCVADPDNDGDFDGVCGDVDNCPATANSYQVDADVDGIGDACDPCVDADRDTVCDQADVCAGTVTPEASFTAGDLKSGRYALIDGDTTFDTADVGPSKNPNAGPSTEIFTLADTSGCSCEQILAVTGAPGPGEKFGCSSKTLTSWVSSH